jgi:phosphatidylethanolamine-binding protein (PEBP) family uncharacterized protein
MRDHRSDGLYAVLRRCTQPGDASRRSPRQSLNDMSHTSFCRLLQRLEWFCALLVFVFACSDSDDPTLTADGGGASAMNVGGSAGTGGVTGSGGSVGSSSAATGGSEALDAAGGATASDADADDAGADAADASAFTVSSTAFANNAGCGPNEPASCDLFPPENTGLGGAADVSPEIQWTAAPAGTQSFAIGLHDLSNLDDQDPFTHWVMWNIPGTESGLPAELPRGTAPGVPAAETRQVAFRNDNGFAGSGACGNVYEFVLYALSTPNFDPADEGSADAVQDALDTAPAVLATASVRARSDPNGPGCN